jgi:siroheme synthase-like protein
LCKEKNIPINAVDMKEECSFIFPAMIQEKDFLIAISSGGQSPAAAAYVKKKIKGQLPEYYGDMVEQLGQYRDYVLDHVDTAAKRKEIFNWLLEYGDSHGGKIPMEKVIEVVERSGA